MEVHRFKLCQTLAEKWLWIRHEIDASHIEFPQSGAARGLHVLQERLQLQCAEQTPAVWKTDANKFGEAVGDQAGVYLGLVLVVEQRVLQTQLLQVALPGRDHREYLLDLESGDPTLEGQELQLLDQHPDDVVGDLLEDVALLVLDPRDVLQCQRADALVGADQPEHGKRRMLNLCQTENHE